MAAGDTTNLNRARALWSLDQYQDALDLFDRCVEAQPQNPYVLIDAARVRGQRFDHPEMESLLQQLLETQSNNADMHLQIGMTYRMNHRPDSALRHLKQAVRMRKNHTLALLELAILYERIGKLREAAIAADRCLKSAPDLPEALVVKARVRVRERRDREATLILKKVAGLPEDQIAVDTRASALASLAKLEEKRGEYGAAFAALKQAKEPLAPLAEPLLQKQRAGGIDVAEFFSALTRDHLREWRAKQVGEQATSLVLMTSFPRSGTTLLESMLGSHPNIIASDEMDVFSKRVLPPVVKACQGAPSEGPNSFSNLDPALLESLRESYLAGQGNALDCSLDGKILLDKNPSYTVFIPFFLRLFPAAKILVPLRDPRDVILSCYFQHFPMNPFSARLIELQGTAERFVQDMEHWITLRGLLEPDQWHEASYERLTTDPRGEIEAVLRFLDVPWDDKTLDYHHGGGVTIHNAPTYADVKAKIYQGAKQRWRHYEREFQPLREILEPTMERLGYSW